MKDKKQIVDDFATMLNTSISNSIVQNISFEEFGSAKKILIMQSGPAQIAMEVIKRIKQVNADAEYVFMGTDRFAENCQCELAVRARYVSHNKRFDDSDIEMLKRIVEEETIDTLVFFNNFVSSVDFTNVEHVASFAGENVAVYSYSYVQKELNRHLDIPCHIYGEILYKDLVEWLEQYGGWGSER